MKGNAIPFSLCLRKLLQAKTAQNADEQKSFLTFTFCLPTADCNFTKFQWGNYQLKKVSTFPSMSFVVAPWSSKTR